MNTTASGVRFDRRRIKFLLLGLGIAASMVLLIRVGMGQPGGFVYYHSVGEFLDLEATTTEGFRVNGKVLEGSINRMTTGEDVTFTMTDGARTLQVQYHGLIPDTFVDNADVVVEGRLDGGTFQAHTLLAKCPSKYESADEAEQT